MGSRLCGLHERVRRHDDLVGRRLAAGLPIAAPALARRFLPDALLLDMGLDQRATDNLALCRALRADPGISRATPIILTTAGPALRAQQLEALRAGAWELRGDPLDMEELVLRLGVYVQGKLEVDRLGADGLVDRASGLYNDTGMTRRSSRATSTRRA